MHIGSTISHYKIVAKLGEGGMGVVYRAEDTTLERSVALKFLADHLLNDTEAKERFLREAKAAAALHHPNICPVYEIAEANGKTFISMAFLEGESLEDLIAKGPLSLKDALDIARQVADGLQAAHAKNVVHRDIKPANILVSPEGRPTIMDFGLARLTEASRLTKVDTAMGTVAYMSPEQAQGMEVDSRSDLWSLGCVLYEMVSGQRPFKGVYDQALLYEIVHEEAAALTGLRTGVPIELELLVAKCLAKDREDRYQSAKEIAVDLRTLGEKLKSGRSTILRTAQMTGAIPATAGQKLDPAATPPSDAVIMPRDRQRIFYGLLAAVTVAFLGLLAFHLTEAPSEQPERVVRRFSLISDNGIPDGIISPDGRHVLYIAEADGVTGLWLRSLATETSRQLLGTEGVVPSPFWSADSLSIGFRVGRELKRISIDGGSPITLCCLSNTQLVGRTGFSGGTWSPDGERIVFSSEGALYEITARGGQPQLLFQNKEADAPGSPLSFAPLFLPAGHGPAALVYTVSAGRGDSRLAVLNLETGQRRELGPGADPAYSKNGFLIHGAVDSSEPGLWALPFSLATLEATGNDFQISSSGFRPSLSRDDTLAYFDGAAGSESYTLLWLSRTGQRLESIGQPQTTMGGPSLSAGGDRVLLTSAEGGSSDVWVQDLVRSTKTRLTFDPDMEIQPTWSPSGQEIAYRQNGAQGQSILRKAADGSQEASVLVKDQRLVGAPDWSPDGRYLAFHTLADNNQRDVAYVRIEPSGEASEPIVFIGTDSDERAPNFSPDGRFVAYISSESGRYEVYIRPFPEGPGRWQASTDGGVQPRWRSDGRGLYYVANGAMMAVPVSISATAVTLGRPQRLFEAAGLRSDVPVPQYDVSKDGQRFLVIAAVGDDREAEPPTTRIVENWYEEFRDRQR